MFDLCKGHYAMDYYGVWYGVREYFRTREGYAWGNTKDHFHGLWDR